MQWFVKGRKMTIPFFSTDRDFSEVWGNLKAEDWVMLLEKWKTTGAVSEEKQQLLGRISYHIKELQEVESPSAQFLYRVGGTLNLLFMQLDSNSSAGITKRNGTEEMLKGGETWE